MPIAKGWNRLSQPIGVQPLKGDADHLHWIDLVETPMCEGYSDYETADPPWASEYV